MSVPPFVILVNYFNKMPFYNKRFSQDMRTCYNISASLRGREKEEKQEESYHENRGL